MIVAKPQIAGQSAAGAHNPTLKADLLKRLNDPAQLRVFVTSFMLAVGYIVVYLPLSSQISSAERNLEEEQRRVVLAAEIEALRDEMNHLKEHLQEKPDANEWVQFVLRGMRLHPLKLLALDGEPPKNIGPFQAVVMKFELEGAFSDLQQFIRWIETNQRLFRVDTLSITPHQRNDGSLVMQLTVHGVMG